MYILNAWQTKVIEAIEDDACYMWWGQWVLTVIQHDLEKTDWGALLALVIERNENSYKSNACSKCRRRQGNYLVQLCRQRPHSHVKGSCKYMDGRLCLRNSDAWDEKLYK